MKNSQTIKGIVTYNLETWDELKNLIESRFSRKLSLAFRGQRCES